MDTEFDPTRDGPVVSPIDGPAVDKIVGEIVGPLTESPALLMRLDSSLAVQELSGVWRDKLGLAADEELTPSKPAHQPSAQSQISAATKKRHRYW